MSSIVIWYYFYLYLQAKFNFFFQYFHKKHTNITLRGLGSNPDDDVQLIIIDIIN